MSYKMDVAEQIFAEEMAKKIMPHIKMMEENDLKVKRLKEAVEAGSYTPDDYEIAAKICGWGEL